MSEKQFHLGVSGPWSGLLDAINTIKAQGFSIDCIDVIDGEDSAPNRHEQPADLPLVLTGPTNWSKQTLDDCDAEQAPSDQEERPPIKRTRGQTWRVYQAAWKASHMPAEDGGLPVITSESLANWLSLFQQDQEPVSRKDVAAALSRLAHMGYVNSPDAKHAKNKRWSVVGSHLATRQAFDSQSLLYTSKTKHPQKNLI